MARSRGILAPDSPFQSATSRLLGSYQPRPSMFKRAATFTVLVVAALVVTGTATAGAAERWSMRGAGWGHGIGLSQWGSYGYAKQGVNYRDIVDHYYRDTKIETRDGGVVRVLLQPNRPTVYIRHATQAGDRMLDEEALYKATRTGDQVVLRSASGRKLSTFDGMVRVVGGKHVRVLGRADNGVRDGLYRGAIEIRTSAGSGLNAINAIAMEDYLLGVVPSESPSSWPAAALQAQAVVARSYALASNVNGKGFNQYADTRSQMYRGYLGEAPSTTSAVAATAGQIVTYAGTVATTFFFSTSGGYTENIENAFVGAQPRPWLKGVKDPYDDPSPYHRWKLDFSRATLGAKLGNWVKGRFRAIKVLKRGVSPRVVKARIVGSRGSTVVTGPQIRARMGLRDTWFRLRRVTTNKSPAEARTLRGARPLIALHGTIDAPGTEMVRLQRRTSGGWKSVGNYPVLNGGYRVHVGTPGTYRVMAGWAPGPAVRVDPPAIG
jgi:stage II sporulation protein D